MRLAPRKGSIITPHVRSLGTGTPRTRTKSTLPGFKSVTFHQYLHSKNMVLMRFHKHTHTRTRKQTHTCKQRHPHFSTEHNTCEQTKTKQKHLPLTPLQLLIRTAIHAHTHAHTGAHTQAQAHTHTHTCMHTHTCKSENSSKHTGFSPTYFLATSRKGRLN